MRPGTCGPTCGRDAGRRSRLACALLVGLTAAGPAAAQQQRPPQVVVEELTGDDWKAARNAEDELARIGARAVPALLEARAAAPLRHDRRRPLDAALVGVVHVLAEDVGRPLQATSRQLAAVGALGGLAGAAAALADLPDTSIPTLTLADLGDLGAISAPQPQDYYGKQRRARRTRGALALLGPAVTGPLLEVPPLRDPVLAAALGELAGAIYVAERERALAAEDPAAQAAFRARYHGLADLAAPIVGLGVRDPEARVRALFQAVRDEALATLLDALDAPEHEARAAAEAALLRLGPLAGPAVEHVAAGKDAAHASLHAREAAARLARRIRYAISPELVRKLGHDLAGYEKLPFRERRRQVFELERLGGVDAIPTLRAILRLEPSIEVRTVAALGLFRQGDALGAEWLTLHRSGIPLVRLSARELAAIHMDQGLRHLTLGRFERAEQEFLRVLELEPTNEIAWYNLACTHSRAGRIDAALDHLAKAIEHGFDDVSHMQKDPDLDPLRDQPRFRAMIAALEAKQAGAAPQGAPQDEELPQDDPNDVGPGRGRGR